MPAEWEPHEATWISWPSPEGISFPDRYENVIPTFVAMAQAIGVSEIVRINVRNRTEEKNIRKLLEPCIAKEHLEFYCIPTQEPWCRDHGPIFVHNHDSQKLLILDWDYNAWGAKYLPYDLDNAVPERIAQVISSKAFLLETQRSDLRMANVSCRRCKYKRPERPSVVLISCPVPFKENWSC